MMKNVIAIVGPTAVGKSEVSLVLAKKIGAEIISGDAFQFYEGMNIGTAKLTIKEQRDIPHHLLDIIEPECPFSVADYQRIVRKKIHALRDKDVYPLIVGGSGLYVQSVLYDYVFVGKQRDKGRFRDMTAEQMAMLLERKNKTLAQKTHPNDKKRLKRSLEVADARDKKQLKRGKNLYYDDAKIYALTMERKELYERINKRVDQMIVKGLVDEARKFYERCPDARSMQAIGYKEFFPYFEGKKDLEDAVEAIKKHSRHFAKRQLTWFRNKMDPIWFDAGEMSADAIAEAIAEDIKKSDA